MTRSDDDYLDRVGTTARYSSFLDDYADRTIGYAVEDGVEDMDDFYDFVHEEVAESRLFTYWHPATWGTILYMHDELGWSDIDMDAALDIADLSAREALEHLALSAFTADLVARIEETHTDRLERAGIRNSDE